MVANLFNADVVECEVDVESRGTEELSVRCAVTEGYVVVTGGGSVDIFKLESSKEGAQTLM